MSADTTEEQTVESEFFSDTFLSLGFSAAFLGILANLQSSILAQKRQPYYISAK